MLRFLRARPAWTVIGVAVLVVGIVTAAVALSQRTSSFPGRKVNVSGTPITMVVQNGSSPDETAIFERGLVLEEALLRRTGRALRGGIEARFAHGDPCVPSAKPGDGAIGWADEGWLCVDALVPVWRKNVQDEPEMATAVSAHELAHVWQEEIGCVSDEYVWLVEGMATDFAWRALVEGGLATETTTGDAIRQFGAFAPRVGALQSYEDRGGADPEYALWHLAVRDLLRRSGHGPPQMRAFCEQVAEGTGWRDAFAATFGLTVEDFYDQFEAARPAYQAGDRTL